MATIERPDFIKLFVGIVCCIVFSLTGRIILGPDPDSSNMFWVLPGLTFGLALAIPNILSIEGVKWKLVSIICFPIMTIAVWLANILLSWTIGGAVSSIFGLKIGLAFIGLFSSLTVFGAFNFFYGRHIKLLNYIIVGTLGAGSFLIVDKIYLGEGQGMIDHFDKLIYFWQTLVGIGISISFKKENLKLFINVSSADQIKTE